MALSASMAAAPPPVFPGLRAGRLGMDLGDLRYLFLARFGPPVAAPLPATLQCEVGSLSVVDTNGVMSQAGGMLQATGTGAASDGMISPSTFARKAGRALFMAWGRRTTINSAIRHGWSSTSLVGHQDVDYGFAWTGVNTVRFFPVGNTVFIDAFAATATGVDPGQDPVTVALVLRGTGAFLLTRSSLASAWKLQWVWASGTADEFLKIWRYTAVAQTVALDECRVIDLGGPWVSDYGIATQQLAGARAANDSLVHAPDCLLEFTITTLPASGSIQVAFRQQDSNNEWYVDISSTGGITLNEVVGGTPTSRGTGTGAANGNRVVVLADGTASTIKVYVNDVSKISYSSALTFLNAAVAQVLSLGTGGAISDLISWPRTTNLVPTGV